MKFGPYLKHRRTEAGLTQKELARRCGLSDAYVNRVENEEADPPTREVCAALARALGTEEKDFWKCSFTARLNRWLRREGFRNPSDSSIAAFFDNLTDRRSG